jgi:DNA-binding transcriptional LysR family regulator
MNSAIELRHLRHFIALAEELHFGRAARRCNISQPPFSVSIRQLEESLGFPLVERSTHEVRLTAAGSAYYEEALKVLTQFDRAEVAAIRVNQGLKGSLDIGFFGSMLYHGLDEAANLFCAEHPDVGLRLVELSTSDQIPALLRHRIQYAFVHSASFPESVMSEELLREPFVLCMPSTHRAAGQPNVRLADFAQESFVLFSRVFSPTYYDQVVSICVGAGFHPEIRHEARHWLTVLALVSKGMGVTLVPRGLASYKLATLAFAEIEPSPVRSLVRGAWLASEAAEPALMAWHQAVLRTVVKKEG